jgi:hypothetical protein
MIAVYDFTPSFCPNCGTETGLEKSNSFGIKPVTDYRSGASFQCDCGLDYQYTTRKAILDAADAYPHGDLREYAEEQS